jgi:hypothetical protein
MRGPYSSTEKEGAVRVADTELEELEELAKVISEGLQLVLTGGNPNKNEKRESDELQGSHRPLVQICTFCSWTVATGRKTPARKMPPMMSAIETAFSTLFIWSRS